VDEEENNETEGSGEGKKKSEPRETLKREDAMQFPLLASASIFTLYLAFKFFDREMVNLIISVYFSLVGCVAVSATINPLLRFVAPSWMERVKMSKEIIIRHSLPEWVGGESPWDFSFDISLSECCGWFFSLFLSIFYFRNKHWALNNIFGICFCLQGVERFSLGTYKIGAILLCGLFVYDIFWVFGTNVMVTVAKNLDGPIKILFPRSLVPNDEGKLDLSLLGLGDIVIPGFFIALLLRFDAYKAGILSGNVHAEFPKPYFHSCFIAYIVGLSLTFFIMVYFNAAQPALLYLVPACLGSSLICAVTRGEVKDLFDYSEEEEEEEEQKEGTKKADKKED